MLWGDGSDAAKAAARAAIDAVRSTDNFNWTFIALLALVVCGVWIPRIRDRKWNAVFAALALYGVHWFYEILNAVICHFSGYALWHVSPESTSWIILVGVCWELSLMFSIAGFTAELLPADKDRKILGVNNRIVFAIGSALGFSLFEIFLSSTPAFIWVYPWWGVIPVFITTYVPFFLASNYVPDMEPARRRTFLITEWAFVFVLLAVLIPLGII